MSALTAAHGTVSFLMERELGSLGWNQIGAAGVQGLATALPSCKTLTEIR